jgi:hypothetical protein
VRILITGSRDWEDVGAVEQAMVKAALGVQYEQVTLVSGNCPTGADRIAEDVAMNLGMSVERHPARWDVLGKRAGFVRNVEMVSTGADVCLAFCRNNSRGTRMTIELARKAGIPTYVDTRSQ